MPSKKIAVLLNSSLKNTALLEYAGCYAQKMNAKLCIISSCSDRKELTESSSINHKLRLIESVNIIFNSQSLLFEIIITSSNGSESLATFLREHEFKKIIIGDGYAELVKSNIEKYKLPIQIFNTKKVVNNT